MSRARWVGDRMLDGASLITYRAPRPQWRTAGGEVFVLRAPHLSDARSWRRTRLAERAELEPVLGRGDVDWVAGQGELVWVERCLRLRRAAAQHRAWAGVLARASTNPGVERDEVLGEVDIDGVDRRTRTGELSMWAAAALPVLPVLAWACATTVLRGFTASPPLSRMVMPVAQGNSRPLPVLTALGFARELTLRAHRPYAGVPADHDLWVLHNSPSCQERLCDILVY